MSNPAPTLSIPAAAASPAGSSRFAWLDTLRVLAGISIIGIHSSADSSGRPFPDFDTAERVFPVLFRMMAYIARTELFIIVSLFLLIMALDRKPKPFATMVREQARRLLVPFAFWVVFYAFYRLFKSTWYGYSDAVFADLQSLQAWLGYFVLGDVQYHMHFLPTLFALALMCPLYRLAIRRPELGLMVLFLLAAKLSVDQFLWGSLSKEPGFEYLLRLVKILTYTGYGFVAASFYGLLKRNFDRETGKQIALVAGLVATVFLVLKLIQSCMVIEQGKWIYSYQPGYWADFLMPASVFLIIMALRHKSWPKLFSTLAPYSFGLYLLHPALLDAIEIALAPYALTPTALVLAKFALALAGTVTVVIAISKVPFLRWTIGLGDLPFFSGAAKSRKIAAPASGPSAATA